MFKLNKNKLFINNLRVYCSDNGNTKILKRRTLVDRLEFVVVRYREIKKTYANEKAWWYEFLNKIWGKIWNKNKIWGKILFFVWDRILILIWNNVLKPIFIFIWNEFQSRVLSKIQNKFLILYSNLLNKFITAVEGYWWWPICKGLFNIFIYLIKLLKNVNKEFFKYENFKESYRNFKPIPIVFNFLWYDLKINKVFIFISVISPIIAGFCPHWFYRNVMLSSYFSLPAIVALFFVGFGLITYMLTWFKLLEALAPLTVEQEIKWRNIRYNEGYFFYYLLGFYRHGYRFCFWSTRMFIGWPLRFLFDMSMHIFKPVISKFRYLCSIFLLFLKFCIICIITWFASFVFLCYNQFFIIVGQFNTFFHKNIITRKTTQCADLIFPSLPTLKIAILSFLAIIIVIILVVYFFKRIPKFATFIKSFYFFKKRSLPKPISWLINKLTIPFRFFFFLKFWELTREENFKNNLINSFKEIFVKQVELSIEYKLTQTLPIPNSPQLSNNLAKAWWCSEFCKHPHKEIVIKHLDELEHLKLKSYAFKVNFLRRRLFFKKNKKEIKLYFEKIKERNNIEIDNK